MICINIQMCLKSNKKRLMHDDMIEIVIFSWLSASAENQMRSCNDTSVILLLLLLEAGQRVLWFFFSSDIYIMRLFWL